MFRSLVALSLFLSAQAFSFKLEPAYIIQGHGNTTNSFKIVVNVDQNEVEDLHKLYMHAEYAPLHSSKFTKYTDIVPVSFGMAATGYFISTEISGLDETTVYRARINLYRLDGSYKSVQSSGYYYTTTLGNDPKSLARNRMLLAAFREFYDSERGFVGAGGTKFIDGTKYGADPGEAWCSEYYSWVSKEHLKGIAGLASFTKLIEYFRAAGGLYNRSHIPSKARRGDYLGLDTDGVGGINHSAMFLAYEKADDGEWVWTIEGNSGNKIRIHRRPFNDAILAFGHIVNSMLP